MGAGDARLVTRIQNQEYMGSKECLERICNDRYTLGSVWNLPTGSLLLEEARSFYPPVEAGNDSLDIVVDGVVFLPIFGISRGQNKNSPGRPLQVFSNRSSLP
jgi:hypothetical protein